MSNKRKVPVPTTDADIEENEDEDGLDAEEEKEDRDTPQNRRVNRTGGFDMQIGLQTGLVNFDTLLQREEGDDSEAEGDEYNEEDDENNLEQEQEEEQEEIETEEADPEVVPPHDETNRNVSQKNKKKKKKTGKKAEMEMMLRREKSALLEPTELYKTANQTINPRAHALYETIRPWSVSPFIQEMKTCAPSLDQLKSDLQQVRHQPVFHTFDHDNNLLLQSGTVAYGEYVLELPACRNGSHCVVIRFELSGTIQRSPESNHVPLMQIMYPEEWIAWQNDHIMPLEKRPCLLCHWYDNSKYVHFLRSRGHHWSQKTLPSFQYCYNIAEQYGGYRKEVMLYPRDSAIEGMFLLLPRFRTSDLFWYFDDFWQTWRVNKERLRWQPARLERQLWILSERYPPLQTLLVNTVQQLRITQNDTIGLNAANMNTDLTAVPPSLSHQTPTYFASWLVQHCYLNQGETPFPLQYLIALFTPEILMSYEKTSPQKWRHWLHNDKTNTGKCQLSGNEALASAWSSVQQYTGGLAIMIYYTLLWTLARFVDTLASQNHHTQYRPYQHYASDDTVAYFRHMLLCQLELGLVQLTQPILSTEWREILSGFQWERYLPSICGEETMTDLGPAIAQCCFWWPLKQRNNAIVHILGKAIPLRCQTRKLMDILLERCFKIKVPSRTVQQKKRRLKPEATNAARAQVLADGLHGTRAIDFPSIMSLTLSQHQKHRLQRQHNASRIVVPTTTTTSSSSVSHDPHPHPLRSNWIELQAEESWEYPEYRTLLLEWLFNSTLGNYRHCRVRLCASLRHSFLLNFQHQPEMLLLLWDNQHEVLAMMLRETLIVALDPEPAYTEVLAQDFHWDGYRQVVLDIMDEVREYLNTQNDWTCLDGPNETLKLLCERYVKQHIFYYHQRSTFLRSIFNTKAPPNAPFLPPRLYRELQEWVARGYHQGDWAESDFLSVLEAFGVPKVTTDHLLLWYQEHTKPPQEAKGVPPLRHRLGNLRVVAPHSYSAIRALAAIYHSLEYVRAEHLPAICLQQQLTAHRERWNLEHTDLIPRESCTFIFCPVCFYIFSPHTAADKNVQSYGYNGAIVDASMKVGTDKILYCNRHQIQKHWGKAPAQLCFVIGVGRIIQLDQKLYLHCSGRKCAQICEFRPAEQFYDFHRGWLCTICSSQMHTIRQTLQTRLIKITENALNRGRGGKAISEKQWQKVEQAWCQSFSVNALNSDINSLDTVNNNIDSDRLLSPTNDDNKTIDHKHGVKPIKRKTKTKTRQTRQTKNAPVSQSQTTSTAATVLLPSIRSAPSIPTQVKPSIRH